MRQRLNKVIPGFSFFCGMTLELSVIQNLSFLSVPCHFGQVWEPGGGAGSHWRLLWQAVCGAAVSSVFILRLRGRGGRGHSEV